MRFTLIVCLLVALICSALASPTRVELPTGKPKTTTTTKRRTTITTAAIAAAAPTSTYTHDCSVFIQRWTYHGNLFDITYHDHHWTNTSTRGAIYTHETPPDTLPGEKAASYLLGSKLVTTIDVTNPINPDVFSLTDTGTVKVTWGSYTGNSWDPTTGCKTNVYNGRYERATYLCNFRCDSLFGPSGPY